MVGLWCGGGARVFFTNFSAALGTVASSEAKTRKAKRRCRRGGCRKLRLIQQSLIW